ncbi:hypothetical protein ACFFH7_10550 [Kutzneria chonburiensis]|uniref:Uncharacterized protein n=1 Tax=Kutzneria chonburiensis TaxID=1483604 RepID=A0ABV6MP44_9PSEU
MRGRDRAEPDHLFLQINKNPLIEGLAPEPRAASAEVRERINALIRENAVDDGSRHVLDTTIDSWVDQWNVEVERERIQRESVLHQLESDAKTRAQNLDERAEAIRQEAAEFKKYEEELRTRQRRREPSRQAERGDNSTVSTPTTAQTSPDPPSDASDITRWQDDDPRGRFATRFSPMTEHGLAFVLLGILAFADAFGFWTTLDRLIQQDSQLVFAFVSALALGSVAAAHQIGKLARSRREGYGGSVVWMVVLSVLWLALGATISGIRATVGASTIRGTGSGPLATSAGSKASEGAIWVAALMLGVYLITGALAMTHAYRFGDPTTADERVARKRRLRLEAEAAELAAQARVEGARQEVAAENRKRASKLHDLEQELDEARRSGLRAEQAQQTAAAMGNPSATDSLLDPEGDTGNGRGDAATPPPPPASPKFAENPRSVGDSDLYC